MSQKILAPFFYLILNRNENGKLDFNIYNFTKKSLETISNDNGLLKYKDRDSNLKEYADMLIEDIAVVYKRMGRILISYDGDINDAKIIKSTINKYNQKYKDNSGMPVLYFEDSSSFSLDEYIKELNSLLQNAANKIIDFEKDYIIFSQNEKYKNIPYTQEIHNNNLFAPIDTIDSVEQSNFLNYISDKVTMLTETNHKINTFSQKADEIRMNAENTLNEVSHKLSHNMCTQIRNKVYSRVGYNPDSQYSTATFVTDIKNFIEKTVASIKLEFPDQNTDVKRAEIERIIRKNVNAYATKFDYIEKEIKQRCTKLNVDIQNDIAEVVSSFFPEFDSLSYIKDFEFILPEHLDFLTYLFNTSSDSVIYSATKEKIFWNKFGLGLYSKKSDSYSVISLDDFKSQLKSRLKPNTYCIDTLNDSIHTSVIVLNSDLLPKLTKGIYAFKRTHPDYISAFESLDFYTKIASMWKKLNDDFKNTIYLVEQIKSNYQRATSGSSFDNDNTTHTVAETLVTALNGIKCATSTKTEGNTFFSPDSVSSADFLQLLWNERSDI